MSNNDENSQVLTKNRQKNSMQIISFSIENENYGIGIENVIEVIRLEQIQKLPKAPEFLKGIINLRGKIIPVVDLRKRLEMEETGDTKLKRTIIVKVDDKNIGMIVDKVSKVIRVSNEDIKEATNFSFMIDNNYVQGVIMHKEKMIILIDIGKIFSKKEINQLKEFEKNRDDVGIDN